MICEIDATTECPSPTAARALEARRDAETLALVRDLVADRDRWRARAEQFERELSDASLKARGVARS